MTERSGQFDRRNFLLNLTEGAFWLAGSSLIASQTVLPALVTRLGGGNIAIGALSVMFWVGLLLPQLFAARYTQTLEWKKPWALRFGTTHRVVVLLIGLIVLMFGASYSQLTMALFFILFSLNQVFMGIATPGWFDMYAKLTPLELRGRLSGIRTSIAGAGSFLCGFLLTWLLARFEFPLNYSLAFFGASVLQFASLFTQVGLVEEYPSKVMPRLPTDEYLRQLKSIFRQNDNFRALIISSAVLILATMPVGFLTVYALTRFNADEGLIGQFTIIIVSGQIVGGLANGYLADHRGNKIALISAAIALAAASLCALLAPSLAWFRLSFFFLGINLGSELMTRFNIAIEYGPVEQRSTYIGLMNTMVAPFYLTGLLGGWISDVFGYHMVFIIGIVCSLIGIGLLVAKVDEPRKGRAESGERRA